MYRPRRGHSDTGSGAGAEAHHSTLGSRVDAALSDFFPIRTRRAKLGLAGNAGATPELFEMLIGDAKLIGQTANRVPTLNKATGKLNYRQLYQASDAVMPDGKKARQKNHFGR